MAIWKMVDDVSAQDQFVYSLCIAASAEEFLSDNSHESNEDSMPMFPIQIDLAEALQIVFENDCSKDRQTGHGSYGNYVLFDIIDAVKRLQAMADSIEDAGYPVFEVDYYANALLNAVKKFCAGEF